MFFFFAFIHSPAQNQAVIRIFLRVNGGEARQTNNQK
jgi:hypothetical protein